MRATFTTDGENFNWVLMGQALLVYCVCLVVRFVTVFVCSPLLYKASVFKFSWQLGLVCWWGGLRGAVGLGLALAIYSEIEHDDHMRLQVGDPILVCTSFMVILTLIINGMTTGPLLTALGLLKVPASKKLCFLTCKEHLKEQYENAEASLHKDEYMCGADFDKVKDLMPKFLSEDLSIAAEQVSAQIRD